MTWYSEFVIFEGAPGGSNEEPIAALDERKNDK